MQRGVSSAAASSRSCKTPTRARTNSLRRASAGPSSFNRTAGGDTDHMDGNTAESDAAGAWAATNGYDAPVLVRHNRAALYTSSLAPDGKGTSRSDTRSAAGRVAIRVEQTHPEHILTRVRQAREGGVMAPESIGTPILLGQWWATGWEWVEDDNTQNWAHVGKQLRALHDSGPVGGTSAHQLAADMLAARQETLNRTVLPVRLHKALNSLDDLLDRPETLIHADAHPGNILWTNRQGHIIDWELSGDGPRWWDLVPLANRIAHFRYPANTWDDLVAGYGENPAGTPRFENMRALHAGLLTTGAIIRATKTPDAKTLAEAQIRLNTWTGSTREWNAY